MSITPENSKMKATVGFSGTIGRCMISPRFWLPPFLSVFLLINVGSTPARAQQSNGANEIEAPLPDAPGEITSAPKSSQTQSLPKGNTAGCVLSGTVLDTNGDVIQGARVVLTSRSGVTEGETETGPNGQFAFAALAPGSYQVAVSGRDMSTSLSPWVTVKSRQVIMMSPVVLAVAAATSSVSVTANSEELRQKLSEQQVQIAVEQRVWKVFPNFYSSYDWNAPPMKPKQKFQLAFRSMIDPMAFAGAAGLAGFEQYYNIFPGYGSGTGGYFKRFGAAYTNDFSARMLSSGLFATMFHQDPRYFYKGSGTVPSRTSYAIACAFITRDDNGRWRPNYSHVLGVFAAAGLSNLYYPKENRGLSLTLVNGAVETAGNAGTNIVREFILKGITNHAGGKP